MRPAPLASVCFVCTGNICRSPTAEGVLAVQARKAGLLLEVDSCGTESYHVGEPPDPRSQAHALARGYDLSTQRARQLVKADFSRFDWLLAMDRGHLAYMRRLCPPELQHKLRLFLDFGTLAVGEDVPDPYYGGGRGFEHVLDLIEDATTGLIAHLQAARRS
ncbi:low molecular weight protein-tyrosine-phosphatase [Chitinimonas sp. BJYL2]|uniref:low molecular weight protein-tyrosine-phosphatase n=1 Tax=Chitinimonas sp. BJYL2 TaxID=2976696 RepID=UPI0022B4FBE1|nr:low molecular weight protein-tyrosine-phosphatase [Chitinimonas sp. BJYL2]